MRITLKASYYNALLHAAAKEDDLRYYLRGVHFDPGLGVAVATDGRVLFSTPIDKVEGSGQEPITVKRTKHPNRNVGTIVVDTDGDFIFSYTHAGRPYGTERLERVDGAFPDWRRIVPDDNAFTGKTDTVCFDPTLIAPIARTLGEGWGGCKFKFQASDPGRSPIKVEFMDAKDVTCVLAPMRL